jgi:pyridoxal phosphate enzyme (YggS family)
MSNIRENLEQVRERLEKAAQKAGRAPEEITLVAVTKTKPLEMIQEAVEAGQLDFGENYAQELRDKMAALSDERIRWHFIGGIQTNKVKYLIDRVHLIHSVDSVKLLDEIARRAGKAGMTKDVLIEVKLSPEDTKFGVDVEGLRNLLRVAKSRPELRVRGLMTMPPYFDDPEDSRPYYHQLCEIRDEMEKEFAGELKLPLLSMGMSHDFEVAIQEGADIVRVGTAIFGPRTA